VCAGEAGHRRHSGGKSADGEALALARGAGNRAAARDSVLTSQSGLVSDVCGPHGGALGSMAKGNRQSFREPIFDEEYNLGQNFHGSPTIDEDEEDEHGSGFLAHAAASEALELRA